MRNRREPLSADLTPMIDVVFLLLIFFLVSSVFKKDELALLLNLPNTENYDKTVQKHEITIELNSEEIALNGEIISFEELDTKLLPIKGLKDPIIIRIDKKVIYERVSLLFDTLQKFELNNLMLMSEDR